MKPTVESRVARSIAFFAVTSTVLSFALFGAEVALAAAIGGALASGYFAFMRWACALILRAEVQSKGLVSLLLTFKLGIIGLILFALVVVLGVHPGGLELGLGSLVLGIVVGSLGPAALRAHRTSGEA